MKKTLIFFIFSVVFVMRVHAATVAYWRFEDGANGVVGASYSDSSGYGSTMTVNGVSGTDNIPFATVPATETTNELAVGCVSTASNAGDYLCTDGSRYVDTKDFNNGWTIEATFRFNSWNDYGVEARPGIVCKEGNNGGYPFFNLQIDPGTDKLRVVTSRINPTDKNFYGTTIIETGKWYSVAITYDPTLPNSVDRQVKLYLKEEGESVYKFEGTSGGPWSSIFLNGDTPWTIGRGFLNGNGKGYVDGIIDEVRISDEVLSSDKFLGSPANVYNATVEVNPQSESSWRVNKLVFGSFLEEHWGDMTPGIYEQYLANPSFEEWEELDSGGKTRIIFTDVLETAGVGYPWEKVNEESGVSYDLSTSNPLNTDQSQHIVVSSKTGGVKQRLALPDYRSLDYKYKLYIKKSGTVTVKIKLADYNTGVSGNEQTISGITTSWSSFEGELSLNEKFSTKFNYRNGIGELIITVEGTGEVWIDQVNLFPSDCVEGIFNPEAIANVKKYNVTMARWPGGNYTSGYHWRDGIGDMSQRPTRFNPAWGGQADNQFGLDEFMRFCELTGITPVMGVGFNLPEIDKYEIADWVEYCNGDTSTPMGLLRSQNGHVEPYNIIDWGIGNETYGSYQIGYTNSIDYAIGFSDIVAEMKTRDPNIKVIACGYGYHNYSVTPENNWTDEVLGQSGEDFDFIDIHAYIIGPNSDQITSGEIPVLQKAFMGSADAYSGFIDDKRSQINSRTKTEDVKIAHLEWGILPATWDGSPLRQTFANAVIAATFYNSMIRNGDLVQQGAAHNFTYYVSPVRAHSEPINPRSYIAKLYTEMSSNKVLQVTTESQTYSVNTSYRAIGILTDVKEIDSVATKSAEGKVRVAIVNRSTENDYNVAVHIQGDPLGITARLEMLTSDDPYFRYKWSNPTEPFKRTVTEISPTNNYFNIFVPKTGIAYITFPETVDTMPETVAYWRFEEGVHGEAHNGDKDGWYIDSSEYDSNMSTLTGGSRPTASSDTSFPLIPRTYLANNLALSCNGVDDYLSTTGNEWIDNYNFPEGWTIEATVKFNSLGSGTIRPSVICKEGNLGANEYPYFNLQLDPNTRNIWVVTARDSNGDNRIIKGTTTTIEPGKWYSIAVTYDRNNEGSDREAELYIKEENDAIYEREAGTSGPWSGIDLNGDTPWIIGSGMRNGVRRGYFDGIIDEVRISRKPLPPQEFLATGIPEPGVLLIFGLLAMKLRASARTFMDYWNKEI